MDTRWSAPRPGERDVWPGRRCGPDHLCPWSCSSTSTTWLAQAEEGSAEWTALMAWDGLTRWCVPVFVLLSGRFPAGPE
jgi:hypothetical protein